MEKIHGQTYKKVIDNLTREVFLEVVQWGIICHITDTIKGRKNKVFSVRRFKFTKKYSTYSDLILRIRSYYQLTGDHFVGYGGT